MNSSTALKSKNIEGGNMLVVDIFTEGVFEIPEYQRNFVWTKEEILQLIDDIQQAHSGGNNKPYYIGTLVLTERQGVAGSLSTGAKVTYSIYEVLDGQQRLTTIALIFAVIRDLLGKTNQFYTGISKLLCKPEDIISNRPESATISYKIRAAVETFFKNNVIAPGGTENSPVIKGKVGDKDLTLNNIATALVYIADYFKDMSQNDLERFLNFMANEVFMTFVSTNDLDDALRMFEVLNNRGIRLRNCDIIKSTNLRHILLEKDRINYAVQWENNEGELGDHFNDFFSDLRDVLLMRRTKDTILKDWKNMGTIVNLKPGSDTFDCIFEYCNIYQNYINLSNSKIPLSDNYKNLLFMFKAGVKSRDWVPPLLKYAYKFQHNNIEQFAELLYKKLLADWILEKPSTRVDNMLKIVTLIGQVNNYQFLQTNVFLAYDKTKIMTILNGGIFGSYWVRAVLLMLEYLKAKQSSSLFNNFTHISIEHVLPQNPDKNSGIPGAKWDDWYTSSEHAQYLNKIGNLVLLDQSANSRLKNLSFADKKIKYYGTAITVYPCSNQVMVQNTFDKQVLVQRQATILADLTNFL